MKIKMLIQSGKIKAPSMEEYRDENPINLDQIYLDTLVLRRLIRWDEAIEICITDDLP